MYLRSEISVKKYIILSYFKHFGNDVYPFFVYMRTLHDSCDVALRFLLMRIEKRVVDVGDSP